MLDILQQLQFTKDLAQEIENFRFCGLSADPDEQEAHVNAFRRLTTRFAAAVRRLNHPPFEELLAGLSFKPEHLAEAVALEADLLPLLDTLRFTKVAHIREAAAFPAPPHKIKSAVFVDGKTLTALRSTTVPKLDLAKLVRICEELNDSYDHLNYIARLLLLRAALNHVPPVFGCGTFKEVVASSGRSLKKAFETLEDGTRPIADLHTHATMRAKESLPTKAQVEPYRASFEILLHEVIGKGQPVP